MENSNRLAFLNEGLPLTLQARGIDVTQVEALPEEVAVLVTIQWSETMNDMAVVDAFCTFLQGTAKSVITAAKFGGDVEASEDGTVPAHEVYYIAVSEVPTEAAAAAKEEAASETTKEETDV